MLDLDYAKPFFCMNQIEYWLTSMLMFFGILFTDVLTVVALNMLLRHLSASLKQSAFSHSPESAAYMDLDGDVSIKMVNLGLILASSTFISHGLPHRATCRNRAAVCASFDAFCGVWTFRCSYFQAVPKFDLICVSQNLLLDPLGNNFALTKFINHGLPFHH